MATTMTAPDQVRPARRPHPAGLVQHRGRPARAAGARPASRHRRADRARRSRSALPDGADQAGRQPGARTSRSRTRCGRPTRSTGRRRSSARTGSRGALGTPAHIYYKYEGGSPSGSHKPNTALAQAYYNKAEGVTRLATETGAGQWGSALAFAGAAFGLDVKVYMVRASYDQKPYRRIAHGDVRRAGRAQPVARHAVRPQAPRREPRQHRLARHRHQRGDRGHRHAPGHEVLARVGLRLRPAPPDGHRAGDDRADGHGRRGAGRHHRLRGRRLELRRASASRGLGARSATAGSTA